MLTVVTGPPCGGKTTITIDPGRNVCIDRATSRPHATVDGITSWYETRPSSTVSALGIFNR